MPSYIVYMCCSVLAKTTHGISLPVCSHFLFSRKSCPPESLQVAFVVQHSRDIRRDPHQLMVVHFVMIDEVILQQSNLFAHDLHFNIGFTVYAWVWVGVGVCVCGGVYACVLGVVCVCVGGGGECTCIWTCVCSLLPTHALTRVIHSAGSKWASAIFSTSGEGYRVITCAQ